DIEARFTRCPRLRDTRPTGPPDRIRASKANSSPHRYMRRPALVLRPIEMQRGEADDEEGAIVQDPADHHEPARKGPDGCALPQVLPDGDWGWVYRDRAIVGDGLDGKDPSIIAAQPAPERPHITNVVHGLAIVGGEHLLPVLMGSNVLATHHGRIKVRLDPARASTPDIEVAIAACLEAEEHENQDADEHQRQGRGTIA